MGESERKTDVRNTFHLGKEILREVYRCLFFVFYRPKDWSPTRVEYVVETSFSAIVLPDGLIDCLTD